jgi:hypothetical protein
MGGQFITNKTGLVKLSLPEFSLRKKSIGYFMWMTVLSHESSCTYDMIIEQDLLGELGIILNFNHQNVNWDTDTIPMKNVRQRHAEH